MNHDRAKKFAENLNALLAMDRMGKKEFATVAKVDYKWLRRISTKRLKYANRRRAVDLKRLVDWFGVSESDLWRATPGQIVFEAQFAKEWPSDPSAFCNRFERLRPMEYWLLVTATGSEALLRQSVAVALKLSAPRDVAHAWRYVVPQRLAVSVEKPWERGDPPLLSSVEAEKAFLYLVGDQGTASEWERLL